MGEEEVASGSILRGGNFDLKDFFSMLYSLLKNTLGYDGFTEVDYTQYKREDSFDIEWHWVFTRNATSNDTYAKFKMWFECKARFIKKVKVKVGNEMRSMNNGDLEFNIRGNLITDPNDIWNKNNVLRFINNLGPKIRDVPFGKFIYESFLYRPTYLGYWKRVWEHVFIIENEVKAFFDLPKF